jgi:hypothetical protein
VYRRDGDTWQKYDNGGWSNTDRQPGDGSAQPRDRTTTGQRPSTMDSGTRDQLNRDSAARREGSQRTRDYGTYKSGGSTRSAGSYRGGGMRGGGMRGGRMPRGPAGEGSKGNPEATAQDRMDENDTKAYLDAEGVLTDAQKAKARDIAEDYREQLYDRRAAAAASSSTNK